MKMTAASCIFWLSIVGSSTSLICPRAVAYRIAPFLNSQLAPMLAALLRQEAANAIVWPAIEPAENRHDRNSPPKRASADNRRHSPRHRRRALPGRDGRF